MDPAFVSVVTVSSQEGVIHQQANYVSSDIGSFGAVKIGTTGTHFVVPGWKKLRLNESKHVPGFFLVKKNPLDKT